MKTSTVSQIWAVAMCLGLMLLPHSLGAREVTLKSIGRFDGWRENPLIGYGIVVGLAGTGDSPRSAVTRQALRNVFGRLGTSVSEREINARNVAVVLVVGTLPASANVGDKIPVTVSSAGDARSLAGGLLLMTTLRGPDSVQYALAQGPLLVGGYSFEADANLQQRNFPTTARIENGATIEKSTQASMVREDGSIGFLLSDPNFVTAQRIAERINSQLGNKIATARSADEVAILFSRSNQEVANLISRIQNLTVEPDWLPRVVVNERTGTVVAGTEVKISSTVIAQGDIRVTVRTENQASQPSLLVRPSNTIQSLVVSNSQLEVSQGSNDVVASFPNTSVADLVAGLTAAKVDARRLISILQALRAAGALNAEIVVQ
ncbi:flagellar basal body P-ring protein FlgI [Candidatus Phycosocius spiralis]|uniref:Flagellar P-ring protein n=1 Tax=Candidatus Phycosocius spiralis TaxID=2815099 RepID=A0ABQ4PYS0_9PROT|nr:flagellar basal body P-ring protein FlgI [Candidatus Phycosocius spiralis]GIU68060.1 flagellar P-ring protein [Candidatus Phycosocius spiralis]